MSKKKRVSYDDDDADDIDEAFFQHFEDEDAGADEVYHHNKKTRTDIPLEEEEDEPIPFIPEQPRLHPDVMLMPDVNVNRPGYNVNDGTNYYNLISLFVLFYGHVKEGISIPAVFQSGAPNFMNENVQFDF